MKTMKIARDSYVETLLARRMNGFVKVITGIRRCGKSYLLDTLSLRKTGDFFKKVIITDGYGEVRLDADGIIHVGVIPFMLDEMILKRI